MRLASISNRAFCLRSSAFGSKSSTGAAATLTGADDTTSGLAFASTAFAVGGGEEGTAGVAATGIFFGLSAGAGTISRETVVSTGAGADAPLSIAAGAGIDSATGFGRVSIAYAPPM